MKRNKGLGHEDSKNMFEALQTVPPRSIERERNVRVTGFYITKFRCSLEINLLMPLLPLSFNTYIIFQKEELEEKNSTEKEKLENF